MPKTRPRWLAVTVYSLLRLLLLVVIWLPLQFLTPLRGLLALVVALALSGTISIFLLDRPRGEMATGVASFMQRMNDRIDASARAEDEADDEQRRHRQAVGEHQGTGLLEDSDQVAAEGAGSDGPDGLDGKGKDRQAQEQ